MEEENKPVVEGQIDEVAETTGEETAAPETESPEGEEEITAESEPKEKPKKGGLQKRIDELTRQRYEEAEARRLAEDRARQYEEQLQKLQTQSVQSEWQQQQPQLHQFDTHEEWAQAYKSWADQGYQRQREAEQQMQTARAQQEAQIQKQIELQRKMAEATTRYPDFNTRINDPTLPSLASMNQAAYEALLESDNMADVAYYLASNPASVYAFRDMTPIQAVKEIARLESKLTAKAGKKVTNAPNPPSTVSGRTESVVDPDSLPIGDWLKWRNSQLR